MDRFGRADAADPADRDGLNGAAPGRTTPQRRPKTQRIATAVDHRYLWLHDRRVADYDGDAGRPDWPAQTAADRRGFVRSRVGAGRIRRQRRNAHRQPRNSGYRRGNADALYHVADPQYVPRPTPAHCRDWYLGIGLFGGQR